MRNTDCKHKTQQCNFNVKLIFLVELQTVPLQIWASDGGGSHKPPTDVVWEKLKSWDTGKPLKITLTSPMGEV